MSKIAEIAAREILDSRGRPTVHCTLVLANGARGSVSVPSGASTGVHEALELRDGDAGRYAGLGVRQAVDNVQRVIGSAFAGKAFASQASFDSALIDLDGTANKARLGANAVLAASLAFARASAVAAQLPLYAHFAAMVKRPLTHLPRPMINLFSGGKHAGGQVSIQDIQVMPTVVATVDDLLQMTHRMFYTGADLVAQKYGMRPLRADEGGLAPDAGSSEALLSLARDVIAAAGYRPGDEVALTVDVAASHFYDGNSYALDGELLSSDEMAARILSWVDGYPIYSVEDGLGEDDWAGWRTLQASVPEGVLVLGDDLLCTNPRRIATAIAQHAANALLLKVNQVGTLSEAAEAVSLASANGWRVVASARSGETEDNWLSDLAVGWGAHHLKVGSITQSERLAKYNRLLAIADESGLPLYVSHR